MSDSQFPTSCATPHHDDGDHDDGDHDDGVFDRLVDGELDDAEQRALIASLDDRPAGWRRCSLAFLEAQNWRRDFSGMVAPVEAAARRASRWGLALRFLAVKLIHARREAVGV